MLYIPSKVIIPSRLIHFFTSKTNDAQKRIGWYFIFLRQHYIDIIGEIIFETLENVLIHKDHKMYLG